MPSEHDMPGPEVPSVDVSALPEVTPDPHDESEPIPVLDLSMLPEIVTDLARQSELHASRLSALGTEISRIGDTVADNTAAANGLNTMFTDLEKNLVEKADLARPALPR